MRKGERVFSLLVIVLVLFGPFVAVSTIPSYPTAADGQTTYSPPDWHSQTKGETNPETDTEKSEASVTNPPTKSTESKDGEINPLLDLFSGYESAVTKVAHPKTEFYQSSGEGLHLEYSVEGNRLIITGTIGSYNQVTYTIGSRNYQTVVIGNTELTHTYGEPILPYVKQIITLPLEANVVSYGVRNEVRYPISDLALMPGPKPLSVHQLDPSIGLPFCDPVHYASNQFMPSNVLDFDIVGIDGDLCLSLTLHPLQYNPAQMLGNLLLHFEVEIKFDDSVQLNDFLMPTSPEPLAFGDGEGYLIVADESYIPYITNFVDWKTYIGFNMHVTSIQDIMTTSPGRDAAEQLRNYLIESYNNDDIQYVLLVGDGDIVPAREVMDPAHAGQGLDNGTEPSDLYFECLDGDWDANGNGLYGEYGDDVDFFPELMVGRIPVQAPEEAQDVLDAIVILESSPEPGDWMNDVLLLGPNCFAYGDGCAMTEAELNQPYLIGSFFDVDRLYPTDGTLSDANVIARINQGVGIIDFFDHGAYNVWVSALTVPETLSLANGYRTPFAFAMACETAAFDYEAGEPTIAEAFFRNPNGGACAYIGATRIAWAGHHAFDGLHNRFWGYFFDSALNHYCASPKMALRDATIEMATTYDMNDDISRETVIHAIYFGDPSMQLYWKNEVEIYAPPCETNEYIEIGVNSTTFNGLPLFSNVGVVVSDPLGTILVDDLFMCDWGWFDVPFVTSENPGSYEVTATYTEPFEYTTERFFEVGLADIQVSLDSQPIFDTILDFSGYSSVDGIGTAYLLDAEGGVLSSTTFDVIDGVYADGIHINGFGHLSLYVRIVSPSGTGANTLHFDVMRGSVLIIPDESGDWGPWYPGGWVDDNAGDSTNYGDIYQALKDEFNVDIYRPRYEMTPDLALLHMYDAVIVSVGDHMSTPLIASDSYLLDVLMTYHNEGGNLFFEGCSILTPLESQFGGIFSSFFHVELDQRITNTGALYLENTPHAITSGIPSTIWLEDGLGSPFAEVLIPTSGAIHVSGYSGSYEGGTAIAALNPSVSEGGVVFFGFSVDAISDEATRDRIIQNAVNFLLYPSLDCQLSDYALRTGESEVIDIVVSDSRTGTPVEGALVIAEGCGVSTWNITDASGYASFQVSPSFQGYIFVNITKEDYLGYETYIICYDVPVIGLDIQPEYIERGSASVVSVYCYDYYEGYPLENCYLVLDGCGVFDEGLSDEFGYAEFTLHPETSGLISVSATLNGYIEAVDFVGVRIHAAVIRGYFTEAPDLACWDLINSNWADYGEMPILIDYTSLSIPLITLSDLEALNPDVLIMAYTYQPLDQFEIEAIIEFTRQGHGLVVTSSCVTYHPELLGSFLGLSPTIDWTYNSAIGIGFESLDQYDPDHPIFVGIPDPYSVGYHLSYLPESTHWDSSALAGGTYVALDSGPEDVAAIITYRGMVFCSNIPEYQSNRQDVQLMYNMIGWSNYEIPEHDLSVSMNVPRVVDPGTEVTVEVLVRNQGLNTEYDVACTLYLDGFEVASEVIPVLDNGSYYSLSYLWTPLSEGLYTFEAIVDPVMGEEVLTNNYVERVVNVFEVPLDGPVAIFQVWNPWGHPSNQEILDTWMVEYDIYDDLSMGMIDLSGYAKVIISSDQPDWFMDGVYANMGWFEDYAASGGILEVHAATNYYWVDGLLPGGAYYVPYVDDLISITDPSHPILTNPNIITDEELDYWSASVHGYVDSLPGGSQIILETDSGYPVLIEQAFGMGSIVISTQTLEWGFARDKSRILENVLLYTAVTPEHDIAVRLDVVDRVGPNEWTLITGTLINRGLNPESDIPFSLYVDGIEVNATMVILLNPSESISLSYWFMSDVEYTAEIVAFAEPVPEEENIANNYASAFLLVQEFHDYYMTEYSPEWLDAKTNGFNLYLYGDDISVGLGLPFSFPFYDDIFDVVYISSNGWLSFANTDPWQCFTPDWPTDDPAYRYSLAPFFADLQAEENVYAWITEDWVVIQYDNYRHLSGDLMGTFQVVLHRSGIIQFNYLEIYQPVEWDIPTVGLNYGDGVYGPVFGGSGLTGVTNFGLLFTYELPEHEIMVQLNVPEYVNPGEVVVVEILVTNYGLSDESDVTVNFYIDEEVVLTEMIPYIESYSTCGIYFTWEPPSESVYLLEVFVDPVDGETNIENNYDSVLVQVTELFVILDPSDMDIIEGAHVLVTYLLANPDNLLGIDIFVNGEFISYVPDQGLNQILVPVFGNGYNEIQLIAWWDDNITAWDSVIVESVNIEPIAILEPGDYINYLISYEWGGYIEYNFTFGEYVSEYEVEVQYIYRFYDNEGTDYTEVYYMYVNVLNGYISWSDVGWDYQNFFPFTGLITSDVISHASSGDMTTFYYWNDLYFIDHLSEWRGLMVWTGYGVLGDFECSVLESNGLLVEMYFGMPTPYAYGEVVDTNLIPGFNPNVLEIIEPTSGQLIEGGLVLVDYEVTNPETLLLIDVWVNDAFIYTTTYTETTSLYVPVFANGSNTIALIALWQDGTAAVVNRTFISEGVVPLAALQPGDYLNFRIESYEYISDFNFTFGEMITEFEIYATCDFQFISPGGEITTAAFELIVNTLNGYISYSDFGWETYHFMFFTGISSPNMIQSYGEIGDSAPFFRWEQILTIDGPIAWDGEAAWMLSSESDDIFALALQSNGLLYMFDSMDPTTYGFGFMTDTNLIPPFDNVPPAWVTLPEDQYLGPGASLYYDLDAIDPAGIDSWWIDDTTNFAIDADGVVTNLSPLEDGIYPITVWVSDTLGNVLTGNFNVIVETTIGPIFIDGDDDFIEYGFPGSGTQEDPYIIAGYVIECTDVYIPCIEIRNTQAFFVVEGCILTALYGVPVVLLTNVEHGILQNNIITGGAFGILMEFCVSTMVMDNTIYGTDFGILLYAAEFCQVIGNDCFENMDGILLSESAFCEIIDNQCVMNENSGIALNGTTYECNISDNYCEGNFAGIYGSFASNMTLVNNTCIENVMGIQLYASYGAFLLINNILYNEYYGLVLMECADNIIMDNIIVGHQETGMYILWSTVISIEYNTLFENGYGIILDASSLIDFSWNTIENSVNYGMMMYQAEYNTIEYNSFCNNGLGLLLMEFSDNNYVQWNVFENTLDNVVDECSGNIFDYNYYSDYTGPDDNNDGIGDIPYDILGAAGNQDPHPLIYYPWYLEWAETPGDIIIGFGEALYYSLPVIGYGELFFFLNDQSNFFIDGNGTLQNATNLEIGEYYLFIAVQNQWGYSISAEIFIIVLDNLPPEWIETPEDQTIEYGDAFSYDVNATDISGIQSYWVGDGNFSIDANGVLTNATFLPVGSYHLEIRAYDAYDNYCSAFIVISVVDTTPPIWIIEPVDQITEAGEDFSYHIEAWDLSGEIIYAILPVGFFDVASDGMITNLHTLEVGEYEIVIEASDIYDNTLIAVILLTVIDTTSPEWLESPQDRTVLQGQTFELAVAVTDASSIAWWIVNDTANFVIDPMGDVTHGVALIFNNTALEPGTYGLEITVCDEFGNSQSAVISITVIKATMIISPAGGVIIIISEAACLIIILIIIAIRGRRR
ncbi:MAG: right-handed parallel beta-helix repeat-containing protein [Candidatus Thorarchaeota archaeon]|nr:right-handed parallel beta-helix repeat-containing protein [Candidatus Thorarchaeota archaeon]